MKTVKELREFVLAHDRLSAYRSLNMRYYFSGKSAFHTTSKSLFAVIEKKRKNIPSADPWRAVLHIVYGWKDVTLCKQCSSPTRFNKGRYNTYCSTKCMSNDPDILLERTEATRRTMNKRYGSWSAMTKKTEKKRTRTMESLYGVSFYTEHEDFKKKSRKTSRLVYGTNHPMQDQSVFERQQLSCMKHKTLRVGKKVFTNLQGYEPLAIKYLIREGLPASSVTAHPKFRECITWKDKNGVKHTYYPDLLIGKRHIVEVKSSYTFNGTEKFKEMNKRKRRACIERGFKFTFLVFSSDRSKRLLKRVTRG